MKAAPPVYKPSRATSVLPSRVRLGSNTPVQRMSAPPAYKANFAAPVQKMAAPPVYRPNATAPTQRMAAPVVFKANQAAASGKTSTPPPAMQKFGSGRSRAIQRHPLSIRIGGYYPWNRDTSEVDYGADLELYRQKIGNPNQLISSIQVRKRSGQDHEVLVIGTQDDTLFTQMDLTESGAILRQGASVDQDFYGTLVNAFNPGGHTLGEAFRAFFETARDHGYEGEAYDCRRFLSDVLSKLPHATIIRSEQNSDLLDLFT